MAPHRLATPNHTMQEGGMVRRRRTDQANGEPAEPAGSSRIRRPSYPRGSSREKVGEYLTKGMNLQRRGKHDEALAFYDRAIEEDPACIHAYSNKGVVLFITGKHDEALAPLERAAELVAAAAPDKNHAMVHTNLAGVLDALGRRSEAIGRLDMALDCLNKSGSDDQGRKMVAHMFEVLGEDAKAEACLMSGPAWRHHKKGMQLANMGRDEEAAACFDRAIREDPSLAEAHYSKGTVMRHLGRFDEALACFRQAAKVNPDFAMAYSDIAAELNRMGRDDEAMESVEEALRKDPDLEVAIFGKGVILASMKQHREAIAWFGRAAKMDPDNAIIHLNTGMAHRALGENREALRCFNRTLKLDPHDRDARRAKSEAEEELGMRGRGSWWSKIGGRR